MADDLKNVRRHISSKNPTHAFSGRRSIADFYVYVYFVSMNHICLYYVAYRRLLERTGATRIQNKHAKRSDLQLV